MNNKQSDKKTCGESCEIYSRVTGYFRPVSNWNRGKAEEFKERKTFTVPNPAKPHICHCH